MSAPAAADRGDMQAALSARLRCEVRFDPLTRVLYSTDASNHQVEPLAVLFPEHEDDLQAIMVAAAELGLPVLARGAGTSLAGQAVGRALILDCSRHLNHILRLDPEARQAEVEPGVVLGVLNAQAALYGLTFGPDPASADRATFGGIIGNNASGSHSIRYGMTADHVVAVEAVLADGSTARFAACGETQAERIAEGGSAEARVYRAALGMRQVYADDVRAGWPATYRRASGYSLNYLTGYSAGEPSAWYGRPEPYMSASGINLAPVLCGSEGTLAIVRRATVRLVPRPAHTVMVILAFEDIVAACDAAADLLPSAPCAVELVPRSVLERARRVPGYARKLGFVEGDPGALLVVEYSGETVEQALAAAAGLARKGKVLDHPQAQGDVWAVRKAGLGLLMLSRGDVKPVPFIEDVAVPVERLGEYVRQVEAILAEHGTRGEWYAHASAGCLHLRPLINLKSAADRERMVSIARAVVEVVVSLRGSLSGEHGDGLTRSGFNERLFGPRLMQAFRELKQAFDPQGLLNPGKVVPTPKDVVGPDALLRPPASLRVQTVFAYRSEGDFAHAVEGCNGQGACLESGGVMCPSYQATRQEMHSTRGRANALRAALSGRLPAGALTGDQMHAVLDLCLECKGCKAECPSAVDMARLKAEFLSLYQAEHGLPLRSRLFAEIGTLARWVGPTGSLINALGRSGLVRWLLERSAGLARERTLPQFAHVPFSRWFATRKARTDGESVVLFLDTYTEFFRPEIGIAAVRVLEACGLRVHLAPGQTCCGRPMISKGLLARARDQARRNLEALAPFAEAGMPILGLEPSCILTLRDEYLEFFPEDQRAEAVGKAACLIEEFLTRPDNGGLRPVDALRRPPASTRVLLHHHCHVRSLVGGRPTVEMLEAAGCEVTEIDAGCCGMAGSFGYEAEHLDLSRKIGEQRLLPAVRSGLRAGMRVVASGVSCRTQILDGTRANAVHPIEILAEALG